MPHIKYNKIYAIGKEEVDGILFGECRIQEKIDGSNGSIWIDDGVVHVGSRNNDVTGKGFRGFEEWVNNHEGILTLLKENPTYHLFGEWLKKHTVQYKETSYDQFYIFDILDTKTNIPLRVENVYEIAYKYNIPFPHLFDIIENPTIEQLQEYCGMSVLGEKGEGIVIRNYEFVNKWGHRPYAKMVTADFKETNSMVFGGNNKHSESYHEVWVVNKFVTLPRIRKIAEKIQETKDFKIDERVIPELCNRVLYDVMEEGFWIIFNKVPEINNRKLKTLINKKTALIFKDMLNGFESVAYEDKIVNYDTDEI